MGEWIIRHAPGGLATTAIEVLGRWALRLLAGLTIAPALVLGWALRRTPPAIVGGTAVAATLAAAAVDPAHPLMGAAFAAGVVAGLAGGLAAAVTGTRREQRFDPGRRLLIAGLLGGLGMLVPRLRDLPRESCDDGRALRLQRRRAL